MGSTTLKHYGVARRSGRYPWGSGKDPQRNTSFRQHVRELKKNGLSEKEIASGFGMSINQLRATISLEKTRQRQSDRAQALRLHDKGYSNTEIGNRMGKNESSIRDLLDPAKAERAAITEATSNMLRQQIEDKKYLDVGAGVEHHIGVSRTKLNTAIAELEMDGYKVQYVQVEQLGTGKKTTLKVLTKDDVEYRELIKNKSDIRTITDWSEDGGRSYLGLLPVEHIDSKRVMVRFKEDGGEDMDGVLQIRRGKDDISLGDARYAQVRVGVDGTHYMKGMAIYSDDMPNGVDIIYNTNKSKAVGKHGAMKPISDDEDNPFGATVRQKFYIDADGNKRVSSLNIVGFPGKEGSGEEGSWKSWSKTLSSQFLSKQDPRLAEQQLDLSFQIQKAKYDEIMSLTNPAVKQRLLDSFADDCDSKAVTLQAAALPNQSTKVLIPVTSLKENEAYAPTYKNGERLVLIRHPHGGTFELPIVQVNNKNKEGTDVLGNALDAIGVHPKTAGILSGADFDGDSVIAVPYNRKIKTSAALDGLKDFDTRAAYPATPGMKVLTPKNKQTEMGKVSNLITDMTIKGASTDEITRAVRHSMVVIDAEKHKLNYKQSYHDNGVAALKAKYQGGTEGRPKGAATLISRSSSEKRVDPRRPVTLKDIEKNPSLKGVVRKGAYSVDPRTGKKVFVSTPETYTTKSGKVVVKKIKTTKGYETEDAFTLSSGSEIERVYANYANSMKGLGNQARKSSVTTPSVKQNPSAKKTYAQEVSALKAKLAQAVSNKPLERQAQLLANKVVQMKKEANPNMTPSQIKKIKGQALEESRIRVGAKKKTVDITTREWEAIQSGAISKNVLTAILNNTDLDSVKALATPRTKTGIPPAKEARAKQMLAKGYTIADISDHLGIGKSFVEDLAKGKG